MFAKKSSLPRLLAALLLFGLSQGFAQTYPSKPIRVLVPFPSGSPPDVAARLVTNKMQGQFSQPFVIDNKPGASGTIALQELAQKPADGYTLMVLPSPTASIISLYPKPPLNLRTDIVAIGQIDWSYNVLVVAPDSRYVSLKDLLGAIQASPGKLSYASGGYGTPAHLVAAQMLLQSRASAVHVPYAQPGQAATDVSSGRVDFMVLNAPTAVPLITGGRLRGIAVTSPSRNPALPAVPSFAELGLPQVAIRAWDGFIALKGTPKEIVDRLSREMNAAIADPELQQTMIRSQSEPVRSDPAAFAALIDAEMTRWAAVVKEAGITLDK